jgi:hypothetical protein
MRNFAKSILKNIMLKQNLLMELFFIPMIVGYKQFLKKRMATREVTLMGAQIFLITKGNSQRSQIKMVMPFLLNTKDRKSQQSKTLRQNKFSLNGFQMEKLKVLHLQGIRRLVIHTILEET